MIQELDVDGNAVEIANLWQFKSPWVAREERRTNLKFVTTLFEKEKNGKKMFKVFACGEMASLPGEVPNFCSPGGCVI